jgi:pyruvate/2-oxoglutarate dehydrogenase complex dihydrolipoamide acyltransferase (E2) component
VAPRGRTRLFDRAHCFTRCTEGTSALPEKEKIAPNQKSWPETAERMGVKRRPKRKRLPEERGITEQSIGVTKGKRRRIHQDPYAGGERSGKRTKPDALSATANARARANAAPSPTPSPFPGAATPRPQFFPHTLPRFSRSRFLANLVI